MGPYTEPSVYEQENYCSTCSHSRCVWFVSKGKEVTRDHNVVRTSTFGSADGIERAFAHSEV
jgi:hypothetical protein